MSLKLIPAAVITSFLCAFAAPSSANDVTVSSGARSVTVSFGDLNVRSEAGGKALLERIERAAHTVCGPEPKPGDSSATYSYSICTLVAVDAAVAQIGEVLFADAERPGSALTVATD